MRLTRCSFCKRPVGWLWPRCRVCGTRRAPWYALVLLAALAALALLRLFLFRNSGHLPF